MRVGRTKLLSFSQQVVATTLFLTTFITMIILYEAKKSDKEREIIFRYYNKKFQSGDIIFNIFTINKATLRGWRKNAPLKIITHGWIADADVPSVQDIKNAYLQKHDYNIITVDWEKSARRYCYLTQIPAAKFVGSVVAELIDELVKLSFIKSKNVHLIGHSVGAHVMGVAGALVRYGMVGRITGLDAAQPGFQLLPRSSLYVLDATDAVFVDCIHTTITIGFSRSHGHADFWPNGKRYIWQPGCKGYSILHPPSYVAWKCDSWKSFKQGKCASNPTAYMGHKTHSSARGDYYLATNKNPPYGKGIMYFYTDRRELEIVTRDHLHAKLNFKFLFSYFKDNLISYVKPFFL